MITGQQSTVDGAETQRLVRAEQLDPGESLALISRQPHYGGARGESQFGAVPAVTGPRVLNLHAAIVFEPDPVYRPVLSQILVRAGLAAECVSLPEQMIDALARTHPGAVFIDCDNARHSGIELAQSVRKQEASEAGVYLIAVTSSISRDQRRARKAAGFDNYIAKPIRREAVQALLARNSLGNCTGGAISLAIEQRTVAEIAALLDFNADAIGQLYRNFLSSASDSLSAMRRFAEDDETAKIALLAQSLRSLSGQVGAIRMQDICVGIEALADGRLLAGVEALVQDLSLAFEHVSRELFSADFALRIREEERAQTGIGSGGVRRVAMAPGNVLLAEPDPLSSRFLAGALSNAGFTVTTVATGREALVKAELQDFQAVLLGTTLAGVDGYEILTQLRLMPNRLRTPVVLISGSAQEHDMLRAFDLGADEFVVKPLNPTEVVCRVKRFLK